MAEAAGRGRTLIAALGNPLRGDDGLGAALLEELRRRGLERRARLLDLGAGGVDLLLELEGVGVLVLLDAIASDEAPGTLCLLEGEEIFRYAEARGAGSHQPSLASTLRLARQLGLLPSRIAVVGVAASRFDFGEALSPAVARALPQAARLVERILSRWEGAGEGPDTLGREA